MECNIRQRIQFVECSGTCCSVNKDQLYHSAGEIFKVKALTWVTAKRNTIQDWGAVEYKLRNTFLSFAYELKLMAEICNRPQGSQEKVSPTSQI